MCGIEKKSNGKIYLNVNEVEINSTTLGMMGIASAYALTQRSPLSLFGVPKPVVFVGQGRIFGIS